MPAAEIKILRRGDDGPAFPRSGEAVLADEAGWEVAIIEDGMVSGKGSVGIGFTLPDGTYVVAQTSLAVMAAIVIAARGAFPEQFIGGPLDPYREKGEGMVKAVLTNDDGTMSIAIIGLSGENMARLMSDEPILFNLSELGLPPQDILLVGGLDEETIAATITKLADTEVDSE